MEQTKPHILMIAYLFPPGQGIGGFRPLPLLQIPEAYGFCRTRSNGSTEGTELVQGRNLDT